VAIVAGRQPSIVLDRVHYCSVVLDIETERERDSECVIQYIENIERVHEVVVVDSTCGADIWTLVYCCEVNTCECRRE
jgi:hypothetical protein